VRLLMVSPKPPATDGKGYQVRLYHQIRELSKRHEVSVLVFGDSESGLEPDLAAVCRDVRLIRLSLGRSLLAAALNAPRLPLSVGMYQHRAMSAAIRECVRQSRPELVHLQLVRMAPYLPDTAPVPVVLDLLDSSELSMRERARAMPSGVRWFLGLEARRLGAFERRACRLADLSLLISARDRAYIGDLPGLRVNPNGIWPTDRGQLFSDRAASTAVFTGNMSYFPNSDAAIWFATAIFPLVRRELPDAVFRVVGREPTRAVAAIGAMPGVEVVGAVPKISKELGAATVSVCPMRYGSGMQTKVLEAMAAGTPVIATPKAVEGLPTDLIEHVLVADSATEFARTVIDLLRDPSPRLLQARSALQAIQDKHTWSHSVEELERFYEEAIRQSRLSLRC